MKVYVQIIDVRTGIYQTGMIDEPTVAGNEVTNAVKHFVMDNVTWTDKGKVEDTNYRVGFIEGTTKIISVLF